MNLSMTGELAAAYTSGSQRARVVTEFWGERNLYCPNCSSSRLNRLANNNKASDYSCPGCGFWYQLKGQQSPIRSSIADGAYGAMMDAIRNDRTPNFYFMQYDLATWDVRNLLLIPHFAFPPSAIIKRNPTIPKGRSQPWIGCTIALGRIPAEARIPVVTENRALPQTEVRNAFQRVKPLKDISVKQRGWTLDVLNIVRKLGRKDFNNRDVYAFESELKRLHPDNRNIQAKIRQQLQVLRDLGLLHHIGPNHWQIP